MSVLDKLTRYNVPAPQEAAPPVHEHHESNELDHDALHCPWCSTDRKILQAAATQVAVMQRLLDKFEEAEGTPHGVPFNFSQLAPAQNQVYTSPQVPYPGVCRSLSICGPGNVTLTMLHQDNAVTGGLEICKLTCDSTTLQLLHRFIVPLNATFAISTDAAPIGTALLSLSMWIEPVNASGPEFFRIRG